MIKIITGFRGDQQYIISDDEAHKAYYLFNNPDSRSVFKNGVAIIGKNIQGIEPAWNEIMGWNTTHKLDDDDWNEIREKKLDVKMRDLLYRGKQVADMAISDRSLLNKPLGELTRLMELT